MTRTAETPPIPAPPASSPRPVPLVAFLDAWAHFCGAAGRRSLSAAGAVAATGEPREAVERALVALGYPEAMTSPRALGATLRSLRGRAAPDGRRLDTRARSGGAVWYVVPALARSAA